MIAHNKKLTMPVLVLLLILATGCASATPTAAPPTAVPSPTSTDTPVPTDTPAPTATATFTATPDLTATQSAEATAQAKIREDQVRAELEKLDIPVDTGSLGWYQEEPVELKLANYNQDVVQLFDTDVSAGDFALMSDITWNATNVLVCGLAFRAKDDVARDDHYRFEFLRISGLPAWAIEFFTGSIWNNTLGGRVHFADAIDMSNGATNRVVVTGVGNEFTVYINGVRQSRFFDDSKQASEGRFGYSGYQETGESSCKYENTAVWVYK